MKTTIKHAFAKTVGGLALAAALAPAAHATATMVLPGYPVDNLPPQQYADGTVWSASLLEQQQNAGFLPGNTSDFTPAAGSGQIGIKVYTGNSSNQPAGFATPLVDPSHTQNYDGTWQGGTIANLRNYLTINGVQWQPLFTFDHNESRQDPRLLVTGQVQIWRGNSQIGAFSLFYDGLGGVTAYNPNALNSYVYSCGTVNIGPTVTPTPPCNINAPSSQTYSWSTNGSGSPDYYAAFLGFDLYDTSSWLGTDVFKVDFHLRDQDGGFEELAIAGYRLASPQVPEPGSIALLALGLGALGFAGRRSKRA